MAVVEWAILNDMGHFEWRHSWKWRHVIRRNWGENISNFSGTIMLDIAKHHEVPGHLPTDAGISLAMFPANERRRYSVTTSLIGWVHS